MNKQKGFTVLEIVLVVVILSIVVGVGVLKMYNTQPIINTAKIKSDISLIRVALNDARTTMLLQNKPLLLNTLDNAQLNTPNQSLFIGVDNIKLLSYPIMSSSTFEASGGDWVKLSNNTYRAYISSSDFIDFTYSISNNTFDCDSNNLLCKEFTQ